MEEKSKLTKIVELLEATRDDKYFLLFKKELKNCSLNDTWLPTIINNKTGAVLTHEVERKDFIPLFTDTSIVQAKGNGVVVTSINKIIKPLLENTRLAGLEINPFVHGMCIYTGDLLSIIIGEKEYIAEEKHNWGKGVPKYSDNDLMDKKSLLDFGIQMVGDCCKREGMDIMFYSNDLDACPNMLIRKDGKISFVYVETSIAPEMPKLSYEKHEQLLKRAKQFSFDCYYAPIGFGSTDPDRFDKSIALKGDGYYANFVELEKVEEIRN